MKTQLKPELAGARQLPPGAHTVQPSQVQGDLTGGAAGARASDAQHRRDHFGGMGSQKQWHLPGCTGFRRSRAPGMRDSSPAQSGWQTLVPHSAGRPQAAGVRALRTRRVSGGGLQAAGCCEWRGEKRLSCALGGRGAPLPTALL